MRLKFRPVDSSFYDLFSEAANHLVVGAQLLSEMLSDGSSKAEIAQRMREAEHAADETTHSIIRRVNSTFVTPFDREDIYSLASALDEQTTGWDLGADGEWRLQRGERHLQDELIVRQRTRRR